MNKLDLKNGQNFITSKNNINQIINNIQIYENDIFIEIGMGKGHFTRLLSKKCKKVFAIEIDKDLVRIASEKLYLFQNLTIVENDILKYNFPKDINYKIFGNIPYNLSTQIVKKAVFDSNASDIYLIVEKGFAKRLMDLRRTLGLLLILEVQVEILKEIPRHYFHPIPNVDSVLIHLKRTSNPFSKKDFELYSFFVSKWVNKEYSKLFTKNQLRMALKYANVKNIEYLTAVQFLSIFNSYKLFK